MPIKEQFQSKSWLDLNKFKKNKVAIILVPLLMFAILELRFPTSMAAIYSLLFGIPTGVFIAITETHLAEYRLEYKRLSYFNLSLSITVKFSVILLVTYSAVYFVASALIPSYFDDNWVSFLLNELTILIPIALLFSFLFHVYSWLIRKLGRDVLWSVLTGRYHHPTKENRIFLFIDLKDSTYYAESLNDFDYSSLLQDFFYDIGETVEQYHGSIYQYVGDEVVITWNKNHGLHNSNALRCFSNISNNIQKNGDLYIQRYGFIPSFKAAMHLGEVVVSEVGKYKVEIAFHGDALNTTSRIADLCRELNKEFLISGELYKNLNKTNPFNFKSLGRKKMRGKAEAIEVFTPVEELEVIEEKLEEHKVI